MTSDTKKLERVVMACDELLVALEDAGIIYPDWNMALEGMIHDLKAQLRALDEQYNLSLFSINVDWH